MKESASKWERKVKEDPGCWFGNRFISIFPCSLIVLEVQMWLAWLAHTYIFFSWVDMQTVASSYQNEHPVRRSQFLNTCHQLRQLISQRNVTFKGWNQISISISISIRWTENKMLERKKGYVFFLIYCYLLIYIDFSYAIHYIYVFQHSFRVCSTFLNAVSLAFI